MLKYDLERYGKETLYENLYEALKEDILRGRLRAGRQLPSKREMASDNEISVTTVMNAYQQLMMEGYLTSREKRGYYVADVQTFQPSAHKMIQTRPFYTETNWFADFRSNNMLYHYFPFTTWKKVIREILSEYEQELVRRGNPFGIGELRRQIADYLYRVRGISVSPECIIIGAGIEYLYARLITLFPQSTIYAVENPGYQKIPRIYDAYHLRWKSIEMDENGVNMADLRVKDVSVVHVSPEHHYPLGTIMPMSRRQELLSWAGEFEERYIIEDDFDCEFRYHSRSIPALKGMDPNGKVVYMNTFSKTLSPAVRISYMVLPEQLLERYVAEMHFFTNSTSSLEQYALARFIQNGCFERHLNRIKKIYRQEGEQLIRAVHACPDIPVRELTGGESGTHILLRLDTSLSDRQIRERAARQGVNVGCLSDFCSGSSQKYEHTLILNYSDLDEPTQREAILRLGKIFRDS